MERKYLVLVDTLINTKIKPGPLLKIYVILQS